MKILLTGADGFLGSNVVRELLARQHTVRTFCQAGRQTLTLQGLDLERFEGNLDEQDKLLKAAEGCDAIIHTAANTWVWPTRSEIINKVNIGGTKTMIEVALAAKVKRYVHVGTANSFGYGTKENPGTEKNAYRSLKYKLDYMDSKYEAQLLVLKAVKERGLPAVIVNPTFMLGPYDSGPSSGAMVKAIYQGKIPGYAPGGKNYVYVKDAATAICNALDKGGIGECYILGNENLTYKEAFTIIARVVGAKVPTMGMPAFSVKIYGALSGFMAKITGRKPTVSYNLAKISCDEHYYSSKKAVEQLNMPLTPIKIAVTESFQWMKENGYLDKK